MKKTTITRIIITSTTTLLLLGGTISAYALTSNHATSKGIINFDANQDGEIDIRFDGNDIDKLDEAVTFADTTVFGMKTTILTLTGETTLNEAVSKLNSYGLARTSLLAGGSTSLSSLNGYEIQTSAVSSDTDVRAASASDLAKVMTASIPPGFYDGTQKIYVDLQENNSYYYNLGYTGTPRGGYEITYTYHHHTLGTVGDRDDNSNSGGVYADDYQSSTGGGCFTSPVYKKHYHTGNSSSGGGCYGSYHSGSSTLTCGKTEHSHGTSCYGTCKVSWSASSTGVTYDNGYTNYKCVGKHSSCGASNDVEYHASPNGTKGALSNISSSKKSHSYLTCTRSTHSHSSSCYSTSSPYYSRNCGKTEGERYASEGIDYYICSCGKQNNQLVNARAEKN